MRLFLAVFVIMTLALSQVLGATADMVQPDRASVQASNEGIFLVKSAAQRQAEDLRQEAQALYGSGKIERACEVLTQASQLDPQNTAVKSDLGQCLQKLGKIDEAVQNHHQAILHGDAATRRTATYHLAKLLDITPDQLAACVWKESAKGEGYVCDDAPRCAPLPSSVPGCSKPLFACSSLFAKDKAGTRPSELIRLVLDVYAQIPTQRSFEKSQTGTTTQADPLPVSLPSDRPPEKSSESILWKSSSSEDPKKFGFCKIVFVDGCKGRVGIACSGPRFGGTYVRAPEITGDLKWSTVGEITLAVP